MRILDDLLVNGALTTSGTLIAGQSTASISNWALGSAAWFGSTALNLASTSTWAGYVANSLGQVTLQAVGSGNTVNLSYANTSHLTVGSVGVSLPQLTTNGLVKTSGGTGLLSIAVAGTDYLAVSSLIGTAGQIARFSGTNSIASDAGFITSQTSGLTWRILLNGAAGATTNTELVLVGRNSTSGTSDLSWSTGVGGTAIRRMTARWSDSADQLEIFSSDDVGASRSNRLIIPRTTANPVTVGGALLVSTAGITVSQNAQEALTLVRTNSSVGITHGIDFSAWNGSSAVVAYSKIRNNVIGSVAGVESGSMYFYIRNNGVDTKVFALYKDYVSIGAVPFYQNDGGRLLIDSSGKGIFTALTSAGTITFSALTAGFVKSNASGVLSVDASLYVPYSSIQPVANFGFIPGSPPTWLNATGYLSPQGYLFGDTRGLNWRGGLLSNDSFWGLGQDAALGGSFKPFIIGAGTQNIWFMIDPLATVKTTITGGLTLSGFGTGTIISTAGVLSNLTGTNIVLGNGSTIAQTTFALASAISGTINKIPKFATASTLTDSSISDSGTLVSVANPLTATGTITAPTFAGNLSGFKNVDSGNEITLANGFTTGTLYMNYRGTTGAITELRFCNGLATGALVPLRASSYIVNGGLSTQFLKGDGSLDSSSYLPISSYTGGLSYIQVSGWAGTGPAWVKVATANITGQFGSCVGKIKFMFQGGNSGLTAVSGHSGVACFRMKQQGAMTNALEHCSLWWENSTNMTPTDFIAVKTSDTALLKSVDFYIRCNETYDGLAYVWEVLLGSTVQNTYTTVAPTATYTAVGNINLDVFNSKTNIFNNLSVTGSTTTTRLAATTNGITVEDAAISISSSYPAILIKNTSAGVDNKIWRIVNSNGEFRIDSYNDAQSSALSPFRLFRSSNTTNIAASINSTSMTLSALVGPGFVKAASDGLLSVDTNTYALASSLGNYLPLAGGTMSLGTAMINFPNSGMSTSNSHGLSGVVSDNDWWRIIAGSLDAGAGSVGAGYIEIATGDDGSEPIYVRQYKLGSIFHSFVLLDESGNTYVPGNFTANSAGGGVFGTSITSVYTLGMMEIARASVPTGVDKFGLRIGLATDIATGASAALGIGISSTYSSAAIRVDNNHSNVFTMNNTGDITKCGYVLAVNARMSSAYSSFLGDFAYFGHSAQFTLGSAGFIHTSVGETLIDAADTKSIQLSVNNLPKLVVEASRIYTLQKLEVVSSGIPTGSGSYGLKIGSTSDMGAGNSAALFLALPSSYASRAFQIDKAASSVFGIDDNGNIVKCGSITASGNVRSGSMIMSSMTMSSVNYGTLTNYTQWDLGSYGIAHGDLGDLWLNAATGRSVNLTVNNVSAILSIQSTRVIASKYIESTAAGLAFKAANGYFETNTTGVALKATAGYVQATTMRLGAQRRSAGDTLVDLSEFWVFPAYGGFAGTLYLPSYPTDGCAFGISTLSSCSTIFTMLQTSNTDHAIANGYQDCQTTMSVSGYRLVFVVFDAQRGTWYVNGEIKA